MKCVNCISKMDYGVEEGQIPREFIEYDFAEDALDFEVSKYVLTVLLMH